MSDLQQDTYPTIRLEARHFGDCHWQLDFGVVRGRLHELDVEKAYLGVSLAEYWEIL
jgi:hypothetical protein